MSFESDVDRIVLKLEEKGKLMLPAIAAEVLSSIQNGSPITGSPGQPVDIGNLKGSWQLSLPAPEIAEITTKTIYAWENEYGVRRDGRPYRLLSPVGGRFSIALTRTNFDRLVDHVLNGDLRPAGFMDNHALNEVASGA